jgi:tetratricopeptide (TPR) repeat protein
MKAEAPLEFREIIELMRNGAWADALDRIDGVLAAQPTQTQPTQAHPTQARHLVCRAQCLMALRRKAEAIAAAAAAESLAPADASVRDAAGTVYSFGNDHARALSSYDAALAREPDNAQFLYNRAAVRRFLGDLAGAEQDYDRAIAARPADYEAYKNRSDLRTQTEACNHIAQLEALKKTPILDWRGDVQIGYALAKEYEDIGAYAQSFASLSEAAGKQRQHLRYDVATDLATVQWIIDAFPIAQTGPREQRAAHGAAADDPIFVLGLPRSGSTLVERILTSHSSIPSAGELPCFALALVSAVRRHTGRDRLPRQELVAQAAGVDFAALGRDYLQRARRELDTRGRFVDKMPLNYLYCGLIQRALPRAKIIHVTRHPMAACFAMYKALFKDAYPFSYDLNDLARYYIGYRRLMDHWYAAMPGAIHSVSYEALVADQLGESRRLLEFCGLEWQEACARPHDNRAASTTASAAQIRRPVYASSLTQWQHYEPQLAGLKARLSAAGIAL